MTNVFVIPENPGTAVTWQGDETVRPPASLANTVALLITHDWGPANTPTVLNSFAEFEALFGNSDTDGRDAVLGAFVGPGVPSEPGAGAVVAYRMGIAAGGSSLNPATVTIQNTTPTNALKLDARYPGTRGNRFSVAVENDPADPTNRVRIRVLLDGLTVERFAWDKTDIAGLADYINRKPSKYVTATSLATGTALTATAGTALAGGRDGTPITSTEYQAGLDGLEYESFSVLAAANLTDASIMAQILSWVQEQEVQQRPVQCVFGGASGESLDQAISRTSSLGDPHAISLGAGTVHDDFLDKDIGFAKFAPRYAGIRAGRGEIVADTFAPVAGLSFVTVEATTDRLREAADNGVTVLRRADRPDADVVVANSVTTFTDPSDTARPLEIFSDPRLVTVMDVYVANVVAEGNQVIIGKGVSDETRAAVTDVGKTEQNRLIAENLILNSPDAQPFFNVLPEDPEAPGAVEFEFGWQFVRTTKYLVGVGKVR